MKEIKYEKELFIPHKKFTLEELANLGVKPSSKASLTSKRYILCEYEYEHKNVSLDNYYSEDHMYHAVYDTQTGEFVMFNEETESEMGPWLSLTDEQEVGVPGLNVVCYYNYDYDSMDDTNDVFWNEGVVYGVFDEDGNVYRGALYNPNGQLNIIETDNFIRFEDVAKDGSSWYRDKVDWIVVNGKLTCVKDLGEEAGVYSVVDYVKPKTNDKEPDKVLYVIYDSNKNCKAFYTIDSQTGEQSRKYVSYQNLIFGEQLYKLSSDGRSRIYPARAIPQNTESILRHPLPIREHSKYYVQKATDNGYKTAESTLELIDYNMAHDYYVFHDSKKKVNFLRFAENNNDPSLDIKLSPEIDLTKAIDLETLIEQDPSNFAKLPTFEFGSRANIEKYLGAIEKYFARRNPFNERVLLDHDQAELYEEEFKAVSLMIQEKIAAELAKIEKQEQECWEAKEAEEPKDPNYDSSLQECIDRERIARKLSESKERIAKRNKKALENAQKKIDGTKSYGDDIE